MIIFFLILIDLLIPILIGSLFLSISYGFNSIHEYIESFLFYGLVVILSSFLLNYYKNYYATNFSEKIKISLTSSFIAIFFQLNYFIFIDIKVGVWVLMFWLTSPVIILIARYFIKMKFKNINEISIYIIGDLYKFNKYELDMLTDKGFKVFFYESTDKFYIKTLKKIRKENSILVFNSTPESIQSLDHYKDDIVSFNTIFLNDFLVKYLRKINLDDNSLLIDLKPYSRLNFFIKRAIDYFSIIILGPVLLLSIFFIIVLKYMHNISDSLIYSQKRYGKNRRLFSLYKIRTMHINSESRGATEKNDMRVYSFARFIRESRLDEFPQILNIFLGHMHLVGPRAEWVKLSDEYYRNIPNYNLRHIVMPGITGWAQIVYPYGQNEDDAKQKLMYELYYIKNWSIWLEIEICIKTLFIMLDKRGF